MLSVLTISKLNIAKNEYLLPSLSFNSFDEKIFLLIFVDFFVVHRLNPVQRWNVRRSDAVDPTWSQSQDKKTENLNHLNNKIIQSKNLKRLSFLVIFLQWLPWRKRRNEALSYVAQRLSWSLNKRIMNYFLCYKVW